MRRYENLEFWKKSHAFTLKIYTVLSTLPQHERHNLISQMRRASVSICANIVEGSVKSSNPDFKRYLEISLGSASECEYYLILMRDLNYIEPELFEELHSSVVDIKKMIFSYTKTLVARSN